MVVPDLDKKMKIKVDKLDYVIRKVLWRECENEKWRLVAFLSKFLNETERNYKIHDKEILVVIKEIEN